MFIFLPPKDAEIIKVLWNVPPQSHSFPLQDVRNGQNSTLKKKGGGGVEISTPISLSERTQL